MNNRQPNRSIGMFFIVAVVLSLTAWMPWQQPTPTPEEPYVRVLDIDWSANGRILAVATHVGIVVYDAENTAEPVYLLSPGLKPTGNEGSKIAPNLMEMVAVNDKGSLVAGLAAWDLRVYLWDLTTGERGASTSFKGIGLNAMSFVQGEDRVLFGTWEGDIYTWDVSRRSVVPDKVVDFHIDEQYVIRFSPDGKTIISSSGGPENSVDVWAVSSKTAVLKRLHRFAGRAYFVDSAYFDVANPRNVATFSLRDDEGIFVWDVETGLLIGQIVTRVWGFDFSQGRIAGIKFGGDRDRIDLRTILIWTVSDMESAGILDESDATKQLVGSADVWQVALDPMKDRVATVDQQFNLVLWDITTGKAESVIPLGSASE
ncbi:MAG: WD40 repeat domain-containing protein [Anaerolineae bacterium]|nr:WD40 repeat domain-containing protein [Anaerolineae bacterium]